MQFWMRHSSFDALCSLPNPPELVLTFQTGFVASIYVFLRAKSEAKTVSWVHEVLIVVLGAPQEVKRGRAYWRYRTL